MKEKHRCSIEEKHNNDAKEKIWTHRKGRAIIVQRKNMDTS